MNTYNYSGKDITFYRKDTTLYEQTLFKKKKKKHNSLWDINNNKFIGRTGPNTHEPSWLTFRRQFLIKSLQFFQQLIYIF